MDNMINNADPVNRILKWWGVFDVAEGLTASCSVGAVALCIQHAQSEWRIGYRYEETDDETVLTAATTIEAVNPLADSDVERFVDHSGSNRLVISPVLADRPVVTQPMQPFYLPTNEQTTIYVSSPVWLRIETGDPAKKLTELPSMQQSDTWFGPSTREGELCYAGRTNARLDLDEVPRQPHRAITPVTIRNEAKEPLQVEKLSLPVPHLEIYCDTDGSLWTNAVELVRSQDGELASVKINPAPHAELQNAERIADRRKSLEKGRLTKTFSALFS